MHEPSQENPANSTGIALDVVALFVAACSISAVGLLAAGWFDPIRAVLIAIGTTTLISSYWLSAGKYALPTAPKTIDCLLIASLFSVALLLRSDLFLWVGGGQDQGVYVNMSSHIQVSGSPFVIDRTREGLPESLREGYDRANAISRARPEQFRPREYEGEYLPGIYIADAAESKYVFQFFPVHPSWMSISAELFGDQYRTLSTNLFSLLSILFFYLILRVCTRHYGLSFLGAVLLCINPLHSYFSKFPVSESVVGGLSLAAFFYLIIAFRSHTATSQTPKNLFISWMLFSATFFTHISGFMYAPFFVFLFIYREAYLRNQVTDRGFRIFFCALLFSLAASIVYGLFFSYPYSADIYRLSFTPIFGDDWPLWIAGIAIILIAPCIAITFDQRKIPSRLLTIALEKTLRSLPLLLLSCVSLSALFILRLGFTDLYTDHAYNTKWGMANAEWEVLDHWALNVFSWYASPFLVLFLLLYGSIGWRRAGDTIRVAGALFGVYLIYIALLKWFVPYQYYFARYQVSELLPAFLLLVLLLFNQLISSEGRYWLKRISVVLFALYIPYSLALSLKQLEGAEQDGLLASIKEIENSLGESTVLLIDSPRLDLPGAGEIKTALLFQTNLRIVSTTADNSDAFATHFCAGGTKVGILSSRRSSKTDIEFEITSPIYRRHASPSLELQAHTAHLYVRLIDCNEQRREAFLRDGYIYRDRVTVFGELHGFIPNSDFTEGKFSITFDQPLPIQSGFLRFETFGWTPLHVKKAPGFMSGNANNTAIGCNSFPDGDIYCKIDALSLISELSFTFATWQPQAEGINDDQNFYGLDIKSLSFVTSASTGDNGGK